MNLILLRKEELVESDGALTAEIVDKTVISHFINVLRVAVGKELRVGVINSAQGLAMVEEVRKDAVKLRLSDSFRENHATPDRPPVDLVVGIPRPKSLDKLLQYTASIGVGNMYLVCSSRVEKSYLVSHKLTRQSIEDSLLLGLQQGVATLLPQVEIFQSLGEFERKFPGGDYALKLIAHPDSEKTLGSMGISEHRKGPILVAIGPEGGWLDHELEFYRKLGFRQFKFGERILRTEVAAVAVLSQLNLLLTDSTVRNGLPPAVR